MVKNTKKPTDKNQNGKQTKAQQSADLEDQKLARLKAGHKVDPRGSERPVVTHQERCSLDKLPEVVKQMTAKLLGDKIPLDNVEISIYWKRTWTQTPTGRNISVRYDIYQ